LREEDQPEGVLNHICDYRFQRVNEFAQEKNCLDWHEDLVRPESKKMIFQPGDHVLAQLPVHGSPLEARY